jgi:hypothetical protein
MGFLLQCNTKYCPRCVGVSGSWPDSQSGGEQGRGGGGVGLLLATSFFLAGTGMGTTDSSRVRLAAGSPSWLPRARSAMSFLGRPCWRSR